MDKTLQNLVDESIEIENELRQWNLQGFLLYVKYYYESSNDSYYLKIKTDDFGYEELKDIQYLYQNDNNNYGFEIDKSEQNLFKLHIKKLYEEYLKGFGSIGIEYKYNDCNIVDTTSYEYDPEENDGIPIGELPGYQGEFPFILNIKDSNIEDIKRTLRKRYSECTDFSIQRFYDSLVTKSEYYGSDIFTIKPSKEFSYNAMIYGTLYLFYTDNIKLVRYDNKEFRVEVLKSQKTGATKTTKIDLNRIDITIVNGVIKNNGVAIAPFTETERSIISKIWSNRNGGGISKENLLKLVGQTSDTFDRTVRRIRKKIREAGLDLEIIEIKTKRDMCVIDIKKQHYNK